MSQERRHPNEIRRMALRNLREPTLAELCAAVDARTGILQKFADSIRPAWAEIDAEQAKAMTPMERIAADELRDMLTLTPEQRAKIADLNNSYPEANQP